jgi:hypothetical protein
MRISATNVIEGGRVLYTIGRIEAASTCTQRTAPPCKRIGGNLSYANSFARPKISMPPQSFGSIKKMTAPFEATRPACRAVDERLLIIIDFKFAGGKRVAQIDFQRAVGSKAHAHAGFATLTSARQ